MGGGLRDCTRGIETGRWKYSNGQGLGGVKKAGHGFDQRGKVLEEWIGGMD